jgi:hypothetical protein
MRVSVFCCQCHQLTDNGGYLGGDTVLYPALVASRHYPFYHSDSSRLTLLLLSVSSRISGITHFIVKSDPFSARQVTD